MAEQIDPDKGPAKSKRKKTLDAYNAIVLIVAIAAAVVGSTCVIAYHMIRTITFNMAVISAEDKSIEDYENTIANVGICERTSNGKYTIDDLSKCNPESLQSENLVGTLRGNIMRDMTQNEALESVARDAQDVCFENGKKIDFIKKISETGDEQTRHDYNEKLKMCSSLRAIPDALPSVRNDEALMASLNQIFEIAHWMPESISPDDSYGDESENPSNNLESIPVNFNIEATPKQTYAVLDAIEKSIREFNIKTAQIEYSSDEKITLNISSNSYAAKSAGVQEENKTIYADSEKSKKANSAFPAAEAK